MRLTPCMIFLDMENKPNKIIVHHTADSSQGPQFEKVNEYHKQKGFNPSTKRIYCGYHIFIEKDGQTIKARDFSEVGQHCTEQNNTSVGICLAGNFDEQLPTEAQKATLAERCLEIMKMFNIPISRIYPHRMFSNTHCYGLKLSDKWAQYNVLHYELGLARKLLLWINIELGKLKSRPV